MKTAEGEGGVNNFKKNVAVTIFFVFLQRNSDGVLAQLVERLNGIQKVRSSILLCSTRNCCNPLIYSGFLFLSEKESLF